MAQLTTNVGLTSTSLGTVDKRGGGFTIFNPLANGETLMVVVDNVLTVATGTVFIEIKAGDNYEIPANVFGQVTAKFVTLAHDVIVLKPE